MSTPYWAVQSREGKVVRSSKRAPEPSCGVHSGARRAGSGGDVQLGAAGVGCDRREGGEHGRHGGAGECVGSSEDVDVADEWHSFDRSQRHPVDGERGCGGTGHHRDHGPGPHDRRGHRELVDPVFDARREAALCAEVGEHAREREALMRRDPALVAQLVGSDHRSRRERVVDVQGDVERLGEEGRHAEAGRRPLRIMGETVRDDEVVVGGEAREPVVRDVGVRELNASGAAELGEQRAEEGERRAVEGGDAHRLLVETQVGVDGAPSERERLFHTRPRDGEGFPRLREYEPAALLHRQRDADAGLQYGELLRDGGGTDPHRDGDGGHAPSVAELAEEAEASRIHKVLLRGRSRRSSLFLRFSLPHSGGMTTRTPPDLAVDLLLLAVAAVWGASFLAAKDLAAETGVPAAVALRFLVAAVAMGLLCLVRGERLPRGRGLLIAAGLGVSQAVIIGLETWGVHLTSATNAGLLISLALVMTPVLEGVASRSWLPRSYFVCAVAAVAGVALLVTEGGLRPPTAGDGLVIAAAVVRALHVTASGHLTRGRTDGSFGVVLVQLVVCAAASALVAGDGLLRAAVRLDARGWVDVLFLGLLCSVFAFAVQLWAVRRTSASRASILMGTEPVWALLVGVLLGGEFLGPLGACGAALIIAASYAGQAIERRHRTGRPTPPRPRADAPRPGEALGHRTKRTTSGRPWPHGC